MTREDGVMLARAAITGVGEPAGYEALKMFLKENPGAVMPPMPLGMFLDLTKAEIEFSVSKDAHSD